MKEFDRRKIYSSAEEYFSKNGSSAMKLSSGAAIDVCLEAFNNGLLVARIEGGIWHNPGFEARLDCIWDGNDRPNNSEDIATNNELAAKFIIEQKNNHDAFIITTLQLS